MEHVFLTGEIQVGKSTILRKFLEGNSGLRVGGFRTVWLEERSADRRNSIHIVPATEEVPMTEENCVGIREGMFPNRICTDFPEIFDTAGVALLKGAENSDLILMDEIGKGEDTALRFQRAVLELLNGDTPIMGVVRAMPAVLPNAVRKHPKVHVIEVTVKNREDVLGQLLRKI